MDKLAIFSHQSTVNNPQQLTQDVFLEMLANLWKI